MTYPVKVIIVHNTVAPYRHPLFEELSKYVKLTVYYCSLKHGSRSWDLFPRDYNYDYEVLQRIPIRMPIIEESSLNPSIIKKIIKNRPCVIILSQYTDLTTWLVFGVSKLLRIPLIYWNEGIREPQSLLGVITRPFRLLFIKRSDAIIVPGKLSKRYVIKLGADVEKVFVAPNVIDNDLFIKISQQYLPLKEKLREKIGLKDKIVILLCCQLIKRKGIEYLLHAYAKLEREYDNLMLIIIGSGPLEHRLKGLSKSLEVRNIEFIPSGMKLNELIKFYCLADIFILPTLEDVWGFVINEAMACGLPVISTYASQAATEMVRHGENGYIVKPADANQLYEVLKFLINNQELRIRLGEKAKKTVVQEFSVSAMVEGFLSAIKYCIKAAKNNAQS